MTAQEVKSTTQKVMAEVKSTRDLIKEAIVMTQEVRDRPERSSIKSLKREDDQKKARRKITLHYFTFSMPR